MMISCTLKIFFLFPTKLKACIFTRTEMVDTVVDVRQMLLNSHAGE